jgi:response regulator of citrate/malate metabolism
LGILFVDDDEQITETLRDMLSNEFFIYTANNPSDALDLLKRKDIGLVVVDHYMPEMTGVELLTRILAKYPMIRRILISGQMDVNIAMESIDISKVHKILVKPLQHAEIRREINSQLNIYESNLPPESKVTSLKKKIRSPFNLAQIQVKEMNAIFESSLKNERIVDYYSSFLQVTELILRQTKRLMDSYNQDPKKNEKAMDYIFQSLDDLEDFLIFHNQFSLQLFTKLIRASYALLHENFYDVKTIYSELLIFSESIAPISEELLKDSLQLLIGIIGKNIDDQFSLPANAIDEVLQLLNYLFEIDVRKLIFFDDEALHYYQKKQTKFYSVLIVKDDAIVYVRNKLSSVDSFQLFELIKTTQNLTSELLINQEINKILQFKGGRILIQNYDNVKYALLTSENTLECKLKMYSFVYVTLDKIKSMTVSPNEDDLVQINKLCADLFKIYTN